MFCVCSHLSNQCEVAVVIKFTMVLGFVVADVVRLVVLFLFK